MKSEILKFSLIVAASISVTSCLSEEQDFGQKQDAAVFGYVNIDLSSSSVFKACNPSTRSVVESEYENTANYLVEVKDKDGKTVENCKYSELTSKMPLKIPIGACTINASFGNEQAASRDGFYMFGSNTVNIESDGKVAVNVDCKPTCGKIAVVYDESMADYFDSYTTEFSGTEKLGNSKFSWNQTDVDPYYVALKNGNGETINYTITLVSKDEYAYSDGEAKKKTAIVNGSFPLKRQDFYTLRVKVNYTPASQGDINLTIEIDDSTEEKEYHWTVPVEWI